MLSDTRVVAIGGGTGLSTMLKGLKLHTHNITAVVTVADDGGSSGVLRSDLGMVAPGDIRNCVNALAEVDPVMGELLNFRFKDGSLKGHSLGNLFLAALNETSSSFDEAVKKFSRLAGVVGTVYPVTNEAVTLSAVLEDGTVIEGESNIGHHRDWQRTPIDKVYLTPANPKPVEGVIRAIEKADIIVLGPGSLYTSIIPNLLVDGVADAIKASKAIKIYVCNIMSQGGETEGYSASDHLKAIERHSYEGIADVVITNNAIVPDAIRELYREEYADVVPVDEEEILKRSLLVQGNMLLVQSSKVRHNFSRLARTIMQIGTSESYFKQ
ncbi:MAG: YvcK family protein [Clostridia bacterium]|nr:YvcK family protein [Clostridia bacterium]MBQ3462906.1 YvcK family protein [Clostridia bacterium]MBQ6530510.1 YvcK family protein [Clostridia bacterium]MBQ6558057.1 YvcK family protein [Clostridia bacterium]MBQ9599559.1 YvcK family protein [Clostridia bacterium]